MKSETSDTNLDINLDVAPPTLETLSFCSESSIEGVEKWLKNIHLANISDASKDLHKASKELLIWDTSSTERFEALELIRPYIYSICNQLSHHFMANVTRLNEKQVKALKLTQSLLDNLTNGYKMVVAKKAQYSKPTEKSNTLLAKAIYRAISDTAQSILYSYHIYVSPPRNTWRLINQLFNIAQAAGVAEKNISFQDDLTTQIQRVFIQVQLLGMASPNNLEQKDFSPFFQACYEWSQWVRISDTQQSLFVLDTQADAPAKYSEKDHSQSQGIIYFDISQLEAQLNAQAAEKHLDTHLIKYALSAWTVQWSRAFKRLSATGTMDVCIGLSAIHYFVNSKQSFQSFMRSRSLFPSEENLQNIRMSDDNSNAYDVWNRITQSSSELKKSGWKELTKLQETTNFNKLTVSIINTSPNGYCLEWSGVSPNTMKVGELIGLKEPSKDQWSVGVICWIKNVSTSTIQVGVSILSPKAEVAAVKFIKKVGYNGEHVRALILPEIPILGKASTLIIPTLSVKPDTRKVDLICNRSTGVHILKKQVSESNHYVQFEFENTDPRKLYAKQEPTQKEDDEFSIIWKK